MRVDRQGFALLGVLWLTAAMSLVAMLGAGGARTAAAAGENRWDWARAFWAREACIAAFEAEGPGRGGFDAADTVNLAGGAFCTLSIDRLDHRINLNRVDEAVLRKLLGSPQLTAALLDWRDEDDLAWGGGSESAFYRERGLIAPRNAPLLDPGELTSIFGFDDGTVEALEPFVSTEGSGFVDVNAAPPRVVRALPWARPVAEAVLQRRALRPFASTAELGDFVEELDWPREEGETSIARSVRIDSPEYRVRVVGGGPRGTMAHADLITHRTTGGLRTKRRKGAW